MRKKTTRMRLSHQKTLQSDTFYEDTGSLHISQVRVTTRTQEVTRTQAVTRSTGFHFLRSFLHIYFILLGFV